MLKANAAAASKKAGGGAATAQTASAAAGSNAAAAAASSGRVSLLQLCSLNDLAASAAAAAAASSSSSSASASPAQPLSDSSVLHSSPALSALRHAPHLCIDVWSGNLREVFDKLLWSVDEFRYIGMDTEFPGVVARPLTLPQGAAATGGKGLSAYHYQTIKLNVELLRLIQLGLCFCNDAGEIAAGGPVVAGSGSGSAAAPGIGSSSHQSAALQSGGIVYQFHFKFNLDEHLYAPDSIDLLAASGIDFARHAREGIDPAEFAELLMTSGIVLNEEIRWLTFHSGFDFAYLLHMLLGGGGGGSDSSSTLLPPNESEFFELLSYYFPALFDLKAMVRSIPASASANHPKAFIDSLSQGGLDRLAASLHVGRIGRAHQAGSDAMLTAAVFFKLREMFFTEIIPPSVAQIAAAAAAAAEGDESNESAAAAAAAATSPSSQLAFHTSEEKYLNFLYGLAPSSNALLRAARDKERAQTSDVPSKDEEREQQQAQPGKELAPPVRNASRSFDRSPDRS